MQDLDAGNDRNAEIAARAAGFITAVLMSFILFVAAAYIALYADMDYYEKEYLKYDVINELPAEMTMSRDDGVMAVSDHMMDYLLHGDRPEELQITVMINGELRDFFTEREIAHMADVRVLFRAAIDIFFVFLILVIILNIILRCTLYKKLKVKYSKCTGWGITAGTICVITFIAVLSAIVCANFSTAFVEFHHIFFDNDLWLLDPNVDLMINLLPESFFADTAFRIVALYVIFMVIMLIYGIIMASKKTAPAK